MKYSLQQIIQIIEHKDFKKAYNSYKMYKSLYYFNKDNDSILLEWLEQEGEEIIDITLAKKRKEKNS